MLKFNVFSEMTGDVSSGASDFTQPTKPGATTTVWRSSVYDICLLRFEAQLYMHIGCDRTVDF